MLPLIPDEDNKEDDGDHQQNQHNILSEEEVGSTPSSITDILQMQQSKGEKQKCMHCSKEFDTARGVNIRMRACVKKQKKQQPRERTVAEEEVSQTEIRASQNETSEYAWDNPESII